MWSADLTKKPAYISVANALAGAPYSRLATTLTTSTTSASSRAATSFTFHLSFTMPTGTSVSASQTRPALTTTAEPARPPPTEAGRTHGNSSDSEAEADGRFDFDGREEVDGGYDFGGGYDFDDSDP